MVRKRTDRREELQPAEALAPKATPLNTFEAPFVPAPAKTNTLAQISNALGSVIPGIQKRGRKVDAEIEARALERFNKEIVTEKEFRRMRDEGLIADIEDPRVRKGINRGRAGFLATQYRTDLSAFLRENATDINKINNPQAMADHIQTLTTQFRGKFISGVEAQEAATLFPHLFPKMNAVESGETERSLNRGFAAISAESKALYGEDISSHFNTTIGALSGITEAGGEEGRKAVTSDMVDGFRALVERRAEEVGHRQANQEFVTSFNNSALANADRLKESPYTLDDLYLVLDEFETSKGSKLSGAFKDVIQNTKNNIRIKWDNDDVLLEKRRIRGVNKTYRENVEPKISDHLLVFQTTGEWNPETWGEIEREATKIDPDFIKTINGIKSNVFGTKGLIFEDKGIASQFQSEAFTTDNDQAFFKRVMEAQDSGLLEMSTATRLINLNASYNTEGNKASKKHIDRMRGTLFASLTAKINKPGIPGSRFTGGPSIEDTEIVRDKMAQFDRFIADWIEEGKPLNGPDGLTDELENKFLPTISDLEPVDIPDIEDVGGQTTVQQVSDAWAEDAGLKINEESGPGRYSIPDKDTGTIKDKPIQSPHGLPRDPLETAEDFRIEKTGFRYKRVMNIGFGNPDTKEITNFVSSLTSVPTHQTSARKRIDEETNLLRKQAQFFRLQKGPGDAERATSLELREIQMRKLDPIKIFEDLDQAQKDLVELGESIKRGDFGAKAFVLRAGETAGFGQGPNVKRNLANLQEGIEIFDRLKDQVRSTYPEDFDMRANYRKALTMDPSTNISSEDGLIPFGTLEELAGPENKGGFIKEWNDSNGERGVIKKVFDYFDETKNLSFELREKRIEEYHKTMTRQYQIRLAVPPQFIVQVRRDLAADVAEEKAKADKTKADKTKTKRPISVRGRK